MTSKELNRIKVLYCYDRNTRHVGVQQYKAVLKEIKEATNFNEKLMLADLALSIKGKYNL